MENHPVTAFAVLGAFLAFIYFGGHGRAPDKENQVALVPTADTYLGVRSYDDKPEGTLKVTAPNGESWATSLYADGVPYQDKSQAADSRGWKYEYTIHRYPADTDHDFGAWAGFRVSNTRSDDASGDSSRNDSGIDIGIRYSPTRLFYGVVAPDLLVSPHQAGIGVSLYAPAQTVNHTLQHFGLGVGYMAGFDGGGGWMPYGSLSIRF